MSTASPDPTRCEHCGMFHNTTCPRIRAVEYHECGTIKRVEFHAQSSAVMSDPDFGRLAKLLGAERKTVTD